MQDLNKLANRNYLTFRNLLAFNESKFQNLSEQLNSKNARQLLHHAIHNTTAAPECSVW